jgi:YfiH family protein
VSRPPAGPGDELAGRPEHEPPAHGDRSWRRFELGAGVMAMFTSRHGGSSAPPYDSLNLSGAVGDLPAAVSRNRDLLQGACGDGGQAVTWMRQVHGPAVCEVGTGPGADVPREVDALFTKVAWLPLGVLVADCAPVLVADGEARIGGAAHAGREGLAAGVVPALLSAMTTAGAEPSRMRAVIGPMICGGCYEVPERLGDRVARAVPEAACATRSGSPGIDIRAGIEAQLAAAGVRNVAGDLRCTAESAELYSYRRDGRTGRFAGVIWLAS